MKWLKTGTGETILSGTYPPCNWKCHTPYVGSSIAHNTIDDNIMS